MDVNCPKILLKKIRPGLVFFCVISLFIQCKKENGISDFKVIYKAGQAVAVSFKSRQNLNNLEYLNAGEQTTAILGELRVSGNQYVFHPVIPFTKGGQYALKNNGKLLKSFTIDATEELPLAELKAIYPSRDTVPENLLKIYLVFSEPMQQVGEALNYISVRDETTGEDVEVFLELENELWNKEHNRLTLWLDPGRIKTDLVPNKDKGLPLKTGREYTIGISEKWKTATGISLKKDYRKKLVVTTRDSSKPNPQNWVIIPPVAGQKGQLQINFKESLDAILSMESLLIENAQGEEVQGTFVLGKQEEAIIFTPDNNWKNDSYNILIEAKLEDLSGNNLNRLFDTDINKNQGMSIPKQNYRIGFSITE